MAVRRGVSFRDSLARVIRGPFGGLVALMAGIVGTVLALFQFQESILRNMDGKLETVRARLGSIEKQTAFTEVDRATLTRTVSHVSDLIEDEKRNYVLIAETQAAHKELRDSLTELVRETTKDRFYRRDWLNEKRHLDGRLDRQEENVRQRLLALESRMNRMEDKGCPR